MSTDNDINKEKVEVKCVMCPRKKGSIRIQHAVQCLGCKKYMHQGCTKRTETNFDGSFQYCCGKRSLTVNIESDDESEFENNSALDKNKSNSDEVALKVDDSNLDESLKPLLKAIQESIKTEISKLSNKIQKIDKNLENNNQNLNKIVVRLNHIDNKVSDITQRIINLETKKMDITHEVYTEVKERLSKESNIIVYNYQDSLNANKNDIIEAKELLKNAPFSTVRISVSRLGRTFIENKCRPLRLKLGSPEHVSWVFNNKNNLFKKPCYINGDMTKSQQQFYFNVKNEMINRINNGESNLVIKYNNGYPTIIKKTKKKYDNVESDADETSDIHQKTNY